MMLAELGADVIRVARPQPSDFFPGIEERDLLNRGKRSIVLDLRTPDEAAIARRLIGTAQMLIEGYRPGVAEHLGLGLEDCWRENPALVYGRTIGRGQSGPETATAGDDINYIAVTGALHAIGGADQPIPPPNLVGDFGGDSLHLVVGILAALRSAERDSRDMSSTLPSSTAPRI